MYVNSQRPLPDMLFIQKLKKISSNEEIEYIIDILDDENKHIINDIDKQKIERFFKRLRYNSKGSVSSWKDTIVEFCNTYDCDILFILQKNKRLFEKIKIEMKNLNNENMEEFF